MNEIETPNPEEIKAAQEQFKQLSGWAQGLTAEQRAFLMDGGWYNDAIKGYLIKAMQNADFSQEDIGKALNGLRWALDEMTSTEAAEVWRRY